MRPDRDGLISGSDDSSVKGSPVSGVSSSGSSEGGGFPSLKQSNVEADLFEWMGSDLTDSSPVSGSSSTVTAAGSSEDAKFRSSRRVSSWKLAVDNKKADLAAVLAVSGYRFSILTVAVVLVLRLGDVFGWVDALPLATQTLVMGVSLVFTFVCGFTSLCLVMRKDVALRGEKFVKRVVQMSLSAMLFMNALLFVLLFSVFVWPDFSSFV